MKWWVIKFVALIIFIKVAFANAHHLIFTSRSPSQQMQYQQYPVIQQGPDPKTELQLKQVELLIEQLRLEIEREKSKRNN